MRGETITLIHRTPAGHDPGGGIIWNTHEEQIDDVLIQDGSQSNLTDSTRPTASKSPKPSTCPAHGPTKACAEPKHASTASNTP